MVLHLASPSPCGPHQYIPCTIPCSCNLMGELDVDATKNFQNSTHVADGITQSIFDMMIPIWILYPDGEPWMAFKY